MEITKEQVKKLMEETKHGMLDCKVALKRNNGDIEKAKEWLKEHRSDSPFSLVTKRLRP